jgi:membrane-anchored mycosin MYCP
MYPTSPTAGTGAWKRRAAGRHLRTVLAAVLGLAGAALGGPAAVAAPPGNQQCTTPSNDVLHDTPWTQQRLAPQRVWDLTTGQGVVVGVIDTGVDGRVPQLAGHVLPGFDVINGGGRADNDCAGHGTFVAGIIAAQRESYTGVAGIAPGVMILPVRQANNASDGTAGGLATAIRVAVDNGARVINISASAFLPNDALRQAVEYATARDVVLVASASNEAQAGNPTAYPAAYPQVIAVGAIGPDGKRSEFSEVGNYLSLVAPGVNIVSLSRAGQGHLTDNGTSYATPFVTAVAALVRSYHPHLSAAQVKRRLELTADHPGTTLPDPQVGWGVVNPYNAITQVLPGEYSADASPSPLRPAGPIAWTTTDLRARDVALIFVAGLLGAALLVSILAYAVPRGAQRRWRALDEPADDRSGPRRSRSGSRRSQSGYAGLDGRRPARDRYVNLAGRR